MRETLKNLQKIPNVGPAFAADLVLLGYTDLSQLKGKSPIHLYEQLEEVTQKKQDPCVLDTFMAAVHYADTGEKRMWWSFTPARKEILKKKDPG